MFRNKMFLTAGYFSQRVSIRVSIMIHKFVPNTFKECKQTIEEDSRREENGSILLHFNKF